MPKKLTKIFYLLDKCIWIDWVNLYLLRKEYLSFAVNVLANTPKILHIRKRDFLKLNVLHSDQ